MIIIASEVFGRFAESEEWAAVSSCGAALAQAVAGSPADWPPERKQACFDGAAQVVAGLGGTHSGLEALFDQLHSRASELRQRCVAIRIAAYALRAPPVSQQAFVVTLQQHEGLRAAA